MSCCAIECENWTPKKDGTQYRDVKKCIRLWFQVIKRTRWTDQLCNY